MTTITTIFKTVNDVAEHLDQQGEMADYASRSCTTQRERDSYRSRSRAFHDAAAILRDSWIEEIDGDRHTATERGRETTSSFSTRVADSLVEDGLHDL